MANKIKIPFTYHFDEMMDYCDFKYVDGTVNDRSIMFDTEEKRPIYYFGGEKEEIENRLLSGRYVRGNEPIWKENYEFEDTLFLDGMSRGRSAANFQFKSKTTGKRYNVFMTDMVDIFNKSNINHGYVSGTWTFCKRGSNYGLRLA
jgi:hypothetical protein